MAMRPWKLHLPIFIRFLHPILPHNIRFIHLLSLIALHYLYSFIYLLWSSSQLHVISSFQISFFSFFMKIKASQKAIEGSLHNLTVSLWPWQLGGPSKQIKKMRGKPVSGKAILFLSIACFLAGTLFTGQIWTRPSTHETVVPTFTAHACDHKRVSSCNLCLHIFCLSFYSHWICESNDYKKISKCFKRN